MKTIAALILIVTVGLYSCKNSSQAMSSTETVPNADKKVSDGSQTTEKITYDMIVSFISKASGIDKALQAKVDAKIASFNIGNKTTIKPEIVTWGREGERDYLFVLKNLSTDKKKEFISSIEEVVGSSDMANITFNQKSRYKR